MKWLWVIAALIVVAACLSVAYFWWWNTIVLERRTVMNMRVVELEHGPPAVLRISGLSGHSACSVKDVQSRIENTSVVVTVRVFLARKGTSGYFQHDVVVPEYVNEIRFGNDKEVIWRRDAAPAAIYNKQSGLYALAHSPLYLIPKT